MSPDTLTKVLATWGALLSTFGFGWTLYRDLRDRAKLKISVHLRRMARDTYGRLYAVNPDLPVEASEKTFVVISALNVGRRPVKVSAWGGGYKKPKNGKKHFFVVPIGLPKILDEWEGIDEFTEELHGHIDNIKYLAVRDASGGQWKASNKELKEVKRGIQSLNQIKPPTDHQPS